MTRIRPGRLERLEDWALRRQARYVDRLAEAYEADPKATAAADAVAELVERVSGEPPASYRVHPKVLAYFCRMTGESPDTMRRELWRKEQAGASPAARPYAAYLESVAARVRREFIRTSR